jgi:hypothetical protein
MKNFFENYNENIKLLNKETIKKWKKIK